MLRGQRLPDAPAPLRLALARTPGDGLWGREPLCPRIDAVAAGSFKLKQPPLLRGTGYVVDAVEAALWAFWGTDSFESGALAAVNLGDDADTPAPSFVSSLGPTMASRVSRSGDAQRSP